MGGGKDGGLKDVLIYLEDSLPVLGNLIGQFQGTKSLNCPQLSCPLLICPLLSSKLVRR